MLPLFPAEAVVITGSVLAANGRLDVLLVLLAACLGAVIGDNSAYAIGRSGLRRAADRLLASEANATRTAWAREQLSSSGAWIIIGARFIPGGRTATTYVAGTVIATGASLIVAGAGVWREGAKARSSSAPACIPGASTITAHRLDPTIVGGRPRSRVARSPV